MNTTAAQLALTPEQRLDMILEKTSGIEPSTEMEYELLRQIRALCLGEEY